MTELREDRAVGADRAPSTAYLGDLDDAQPEGEEQQGLLPAGRLAVSARRAAIAAALALLGTYFERGRASLTTSQGPSQEGDPAIGRLLAALRLRTALAATGRLTRLAEAITRRSNFRYERVRRETVGAVRARLDIDRYVTGLGQFQVPPRYPVTEVVRTQATPENTLLVCAAQWVLEELSQPDLLAVLPEGPEGTAAKDARETIKRLLSLPLFAVCGRDAREVTRLRRLPRLINQVKHRLSSGRVADPSAYRELTSWIAGCLAGQPAARAGDLDWSFYGDAFDTKLFELWCLRRLAAEVGEALGQPPPVPDLTLRGREPMYRWETPLGELEIHYQRSPTAHGRTQEWTRADGKKGLGGIPDITVLGRRDFGLRLVLFDPKLRRRDAVPGDELFKMLGYFEQYGEHRDGQGALLLYGSDDRARPYKNGTGAGTLLETTVEPERGEEQASEAWRALAALALGAVSLETLVPEGASPRRPRPEPGTEEAIDEAQHRAVRVLEALAAQVGNAALRPWRNQLEAIFEDAWPILGSETQEMCTTAVYLGNVLTEGRDYSGPVLGLAAAAEKLLWEHLLVPAAQVEPSVADQHMLGQVLALLDQALSGNGSSRATAIRSVLNGRGTDFSALSFTAAGLHDVNRRYRRPAAHRDLLPKQDWVGCNRVMLLAADPLLPRLASLLLLP